MAGPFSLVITISESHDELAESLGPVWLHPPAPPAVTPALAMGGWQHDVFLGGQPCIGHAFVHGGRIRENVRSEFWWAGVVAGRQPGYGQPQYGQPQYGQPQPGPAGMGPVVMGGMADMARRRGRRQVITGSVLFLIGLVITIFTYSHAASSATDGTYFVAWDPMVFGIIAVVRGLLALSRAQRLSRQPPGRPGPRARRPARSTGARRGP